MIRRSSVLFAGAAAVAGLVLLAPAAEAQGGRGKQPAGKQPAGKQPAAAPAPPPASAPPPVSAIGLRIVGPGLGANGTELKPFNESPGTAVVLSIQAPKGSGIVDVDDRGSKLDAFSDDKGQSLLEEGRIGPFPKVAEDGSAALVEVEVRARPSAGASAISAQGTVALTVAGGSKPFKAAAVKLDANQTFKIGTTTMTVAQAKAEDEETKITVNLPRSVLQTIREIRFLDAKGAPLEGRRTGSGYFNEKAELELSVKTKDKVIGLEFELWQNLRTVKAPFNVQVGLGVAAGGRAVGSSDAPAGDAAKAEPAPKKPEGPPP